VTETGTVGLRGSRLNLPRFRTHPQKGIEDDGRKSASCRPQGTHNPNEVIGKIRRRPCFDETGSEGTGVIAGGRSRAVLETVGDPRHPYQMHPIQQSLTTLFLQTMDGLLRA
jgi:hypothetical protein